MLSRVANNLFWMDRYMERSYGLLNLIKTNYNSTLDTGDYDSWNGILKSYMGIDKNISNENYQDSISVIEYMIFNNSNPNTLINMITKARENARSVQEHISREIWVAVNKYFLKITDKKFYKYYKKNDPIDFINELTQFHHIYYSVADISQERGNAFCFMNLGKYFERILQSIDFLNVKIDILESNENNLNESYFWKNLLISIGGYQLYIKTYKSIFNVENIIEMITINQFFPRSIKFSVDKLYSHITRLNEFNKPETNSLTFLTGKMKNELTYTSISSIKEEGLKNFVYKIQYDLNSISNEINNIYFYQNN